MVGGREVVAGVAERVEERSSGEGVVERRLRFANGDEDVIGETEQSARCLAVYADGCAMRVGILCDGKTYELTPQRGFDVTALHAPDAAKKKGMSRNQSAQLPARRPCECVYVPRAFIAFHAASESI